ncbi:MAG: glycoside hydrolase family 3 C-terminal domain-containing protein, partial [Clostridia bacterium]|nr:glycoside hydrolase family 3 C-terminal domain-containing protein [Clostridia bacterium]
MISISRYSGEGIDRTADPEFADFYLSDVEKRLIERTKKAFKKTVIVLNVGGMVDSEWFIKDEQIDAVLLGWQAGMEGASAVADILVGDVNPSGKLVDTFADSFDAYPSSATFNESDEYVEYTDDIFVGYRYFETIPGAAARVNYPFGYGKSYTEFALSARFGHESDGRIALSATVTNIGKCAGKEVVQVYVTAPQGKLG